MSIYPLEIEIANLTVDSFVVLIFGSKVGAYSKIHENDDMTSLSPTICDIRT